MTFSHDSLHGLGRCANCSHPVAAAPVSIFDRTPFSMSSCPGCGARYPHPEERVQLKNAKRTAILGAVLIGVAVTAIQVVTLQQLSLLV